MNDNLINDAIEILRLNDRGTYTVPTPGLYPFQWNWDSALSALGFSHFDEKRAWTEIETLFANQWDDGMVPHIIFHEEDKGYFPGPEVWDTKRPVPTSGITQPPVAAFSAKRIFDRAVDRALAEDRVGALLPKMHAWHEWFFRCRDPQETGLVAIIHPWESGRDNSVDWDAPFAHVPTDGVMPFQRRDTQHTDPSHRPTDEQYKRYIWLLQLFRSLEWDNNKLHDASPFRIVDPGFNAILLRSCADLADLAEALGEREMAKVARARVDAGVAALDALWSDEYGQFLCYDRVIDAPIRSPSIGGLLAAFAPISTHRAEAIARRIEDLATRSTFLVPSHDPATAEFDSLRYWRGPIWLVVNTMIANGLDRAGQTDVANRIRTDSVKLIRQSGFAEYYDPITAEPCGGGQFTWTAAMIIETLKLHGEKA